MRLPERRGNAAGKIDDRRVVRRDEGGEPFLIIPADRIAGVKFEGQVANDRGLLVAQGTAAELKQRVSAQRLDLTCAGQAAFDELTRYFGDRAMHRDPASLTLGVPTDGSAAQVRALLDAADPGRALVASFAVRGASLDDVFLTLTRHDTVKETSRV